MRFRKEKIGIVADIKKAFLQIAVAKEECDFLRFLWWEDFEERRLKIFRHKRVVFGLTCSPVILAAVLNHIIEESPTDMQETANILKKSFYVDNCVTSVPNKDKLEKLIEESRLLLNEACFDLRGWEHTSLQKSTNSGKPIQVLEMLWDNKEDNIFCDLSTVKEIKSSITRRSILSTVHKIFDPLRILCPVTLSPKIIVQQTWTLKIGWDAELPEKYRNEFENWSNDLSLLSEVKIPRNLDICNTNAKLSLHIFCDASKFGYSSVMFIRKIQYNLTSVHFLQAKSRVAPLHKMTIPRLELLACCIGARLASTIIKAMDLQDVPTTYWTDSSTALCWIKREEHWGVFVNNRVKEIRELSKKAWNHVPGDYNPADLPSRGCSVKYLLKSRWWEGPLWLRLDEKDWPSTEFKTQEEEIYKEKRKGHTSILICSDITDRWHSRRFSKYTQILRMIAWVFRFINKARKRDRRSEKELLISELEFAEKKLVKVVQDEALKEEDMKTLCTFKDIRTIGFPDLDHLDEINISKKFKYQQTLRETFRRRFRDEYLSLLIQRPLKNKHLVRESKLGDLVFVSCDNKKRIDWPLGRIVSTFPGKDNCIRVVKVKTATGELTKPVQKVHPLEISQNDPLYKEISVKIKNDSKDIILRKNC